jgi:hypothetical protein
VTPSQVLNHHNTWPLPILVPDNSSCEWKLWSQLCRFPAAEMFVLPVESKSSQVRGRLSSACPSFLWIVCLHDYNFPPSCQLSSAFPYHSILFYDLNINNLLGIVMPQAFQPAVETRLPKSTAELNRGSITALNTKHPELRQRGPPHLPHSTLRVTHAAVCQSVSRPRCALPLLLISKGGCRPILTIPPHLFMETNV